jgi:hypothetical protein
MSYIPNLEKIEITDNASGESIKVESTANASLVLNADTDNDAGEVGAPFVQFKQDASLTTSVAGITQANGFDSSGAACTGAINNNFLINSSFPIQFATSSNVRATISNSGITLSEGTGSAYGFIQVGTNATATNNWHITNNTVGAFELYSGNFGAGTYIYGMDRFGFATFTNQFNGRRAYIDNNGSNANAAVEVLELRRNSSQTANIQSWRTSAGVIYRFVSNTGTDNFTSDARLKREVSNYNRGLSEVMQLRPVSFKWVEEMETGETVKYGFLAQEFQQVVPEAVDEQNDEQKTLSLKSEVFNPLLVKAIQELKAELDAVKAELASLKG